MLANNPIAQKTVTTVVQALICNKRRMARNVG